MLLPTKWAFLWLLQLLREVGKLQALIIDSHALKINREAISINQDFIALGSIRISYEFCN